MKKILIASIALALLSFTQPSVSFTLRNNSLKSIPLNIPGVMNPNLSPMSNSGVSLKVGQKIYFYPNGKKVFSKKELLLEVTEDLKGKTLKVNELIKEREKELKEEKEKE